MFIFESYSVVTDSCHDTIQQAVCFVLCFVFQYFSACLPPYQPFFVGRDNEECSGSSGISLAIELDALLLQVAGATVWEGVADLLGGLTTVDANVSRHNLGMVMISAVTASG